MTKRTPMKSVQKRSEDSNELQRLKDEKIARLEEQIAKLMEGGNQKMANNPTTSEARYSNNDQDAEDTKRIRGHTEKSSTMGVKIIAPTLMECTEQATQKFYREYIAYEEKLQRLEGLNGVKILKQPRLDLIDKSVQTVWKMLYLKPDETEVTDQNVEDVIKRIIEIDAKVHPEDILGYKSIKMKDLPQITTSVTTFLHEIEEQKRKAGIARYPAKKFTEYFLAQIRNEDLKYNVEQRVYREESEDLFLNIDKFAKLVLEMAQLYDNAVGTRKRTEEAKKPNSKKDGQGNKPKGNFNSREKKESYAERQKLKCTNCGKNGHVLDGCWKKEGGAKGTKPAYKKSEYKKHEGGNSEQKTKFGNQKPAVAVKSDYNTRSKTATTESVRRCDIHEISNLEDTLFETVTHEDEMDLSDDAFRSGLMNATHDIPLLLDSGASINFVNESMVKKLNLEWVHHRPFRINSVNEEKVDIGRGMVKFRLTLDTIGGLLTVTWMAGVLTEGLVKTNKDDYLIIGRKSQKELGWDPNQFLRERYHMTHLVGKNADYERVEASCTEIACIEDEEIDKENYIPTFTVTQEYEAERQQHIANMITRSTINIKKETIKIKFLELIDTYDDRFQHQLKDPEAMRVEPVRLKLKEDFIPKRQAIRSHAPAMREHIARTFQEHVKNGFAEQLSTTEWAQNVHAVSKGAGKYRMTLDARDLNAQLQKETGNTMNVETSLYKLANKKVFNSLDMTQAYWQIPMKVEDPPIVVARTPDGDFAQTRLPQGVASAGFHCQNRVSGCIMPVAPNDTFVYQDDILNHMVDNEVAIKVTEGVLQACRKYNIYLNPKKSTWFAVKAIWCGLELVNGTWSYTEEWREGIKQLPYPQHADELSSFVHGSNWGRSSLPGYVKVTDPLYTLLKECAREVGTSKKSKLKRVLLKGKWTEEHSEAWDKTKDLIHSAMKHNFPDRSKVQCMWTDASDEYWSIVITQIEPDDAGKYLESQDHEFLFILQGKFSETAQRWHILSKEAFPIVKGLTRLDWLVQTSDGGFRIYTDSQVISYIFNPKKMITTSSKATATRVGRYALLIQEYIYTLEHVKGETNHMADLTTRPQRGIPQHNIHYIRCSTGELFGEEIAEDVNRYHTNDYKCNEKVFQLIHDQEKINVDCFSSDANCHECEDHITASENAFTFTVTDGVGWMNPPYNLRTRAIKWAIEQVRNNMTMWILYPEWKSDKGYKDLKLQGVKIFTFPRGVRLFTNPDKGTLATPWKVNLWRMSTHGEMQEVAALQRELGEWVGADVAPGIDISYRPLLDENYDFPDLSRIFEAQQGYEPTLECIKDQHGYLRTKEGKLWLPNTEDTLALRQSIYVAAHAGKYGGHRRQISTMNMLNHVTWRGCKTEVMAWLKLCKHCLHATDRKAIPRPYGPTKRGTYPNEVISMDHYSFGEDRKCVELIDTFTGLITVEKGPASGETGTRLLWRWIRERDVPAFIITDSGSHFLCEVFAGLMEKYNISHMPTTPYSPWSNGLVERRNRIFNTGIRAVSNELRAQKEDWFEILQSICYNINRNGSSANNGLSPFEMNSGRRTTEFTDKIMVLRDTELEFLDAAKIGHLYKTIRDNLEVQHHMVQDHHEDLERIKELHNSNLLPNFTIGDYVLVAVPKDQKQEKSKTRWKGPYEIVGTKYDYVYEVRDLNADRTFTAHATRLIFYDSKKVGQDGTTESKLKEQAALTSDGTFFIEELHEFDPQRGILVKWWGFEEPTWTDFHMLLEDAPTRCEEFFETLTESDQRKWSKMTTTNNDSE